VVKEDIRKSMHQGRNNTDDKDHFSNNNKKPILKQEFILDDSY